MRLTIPSNKTKFLIEMRDGSDRVCAILGGTFADVALQKAIRKSLKNTAHIKDMFNAKSELSGFLAKTELAFGMGLIGEQPRSDLKKIGQIRNKFAHNLDINSFESQAIKDICAQLWIPNNPEALKMPQSWKNALTHPTKGKSIYRVHFEWTVAIIVGGLYVVAFDKDDTQSPLVWD